MNITETRELLDYLENQDITKIGITLSAKDEKEADELMSFLRKDYNVVLEKTVWGEHQITVLKK